MKHPPQTAFAKLRRARTISQVELAQIIGVSQEVISLAERGKRTLKPDVQERIAVVLGTAREVLFPEELAG